MTRQLAILPILLLIAISSLAAGPTALTDESAKISYSLGYQIGGDFKRQGVAMNAAAVVQGIEDALGSREPALSAQEMNNLLVSLKQRVVAAEHRAVQQGSQEFIAANRLKPGVKELPGGVQYRVIKAGHGASPGLEDTVDVHFRTVRPDGTTIASTRTETAPRAYQVKAMLPGLQQALLKMQPGATWEVVLLVSGRNEVLESGGVLIYEIELVSIHPAPAAGS